MSVQTNPEYFGTTKSGGLNFLGGFFKTLGLGDLWNSISGAGLTSAEIEQNEFNAREAEKARAFDAEQAQINRDYQTQMDNTKVQRSVADMQAAGVNPAMMMGASGVTSSTPSGSAASGPSASGAGHSGTATIGELMDIIFAKQRFDATKAQIDSIKAGTKKTEADTEKTQVETDYQKLVNEYYPNLTDASIKQIYSAIGVNESTIDFQAAQTALAEINGQLAAVDLSWKDSLNDAELAFKEASTHSQKAAAAQAYAATAMTALETKYMHEHGMHMGTNQQVAALQYFTNALGLEDADFIGAVGDTIKSGSKAVSAYKRAREAGYSHRDIWKAFLSSYK